MCRWTLSSSDAALPFWYKTKEQSLKKIFFTEKSEQLMLIVQPPNHIPLQIYNYAG